MKNRIKKFLNLTAGGIGVVEIILILVVLISLVLIFRDQITGIINKAFEAITNDTTTIFS